MRNLDWCAMVGEEVGPGTASASALTVGRTSVVVGVVAKSEGAGLGCWRKTVPVACSVVNAHGHVAGAQGAVVMLQLKTSEVEGETVQRTLDCY